MSYNPTKKDDDLNKYLEEQEERKRQIERLQEIDTYFRKIEKKENRQFKLEVLTGILIPSSMIIIFLYYILFMV